MCGIVGLFTKNNKLHDTLGLHLSHMLLEMSERGPDSAGVALYNTDKQSIHGKMVLFSSDENIDWQSLCTHIEQTFAVSLTYQKRHNHLLINITQADNTLKLPKLQRWLLQKFNSVRLMSLGHIIEIYKEQGLPSAFIDNFDLTNWRGSHALGHTRMATESAITTEHSHPFSTGEDLCLVHNGSLSNHSLIRRDLQKKGIILQTDNDSEAAAGYLAWKLSAGLNLEQAMNDAFNDLDGFYTFAVGSRNGFAIVRDAIACKPAVIAETDDWVAMASEYRAIAVLPGAKLARVWEPEPCRVYSWQRELNNAS